MQPLPDLEAWAIFSRVIETGSFAKAAESLGMSQPTVSKAITRLEQRLGTTLLYRTSRRFSLTPAGEAARERAARILVEGETVEAEASEQAVTARGTIRLTIPISFGLKYVSPLILEFLERHPEIHIEVLMTDECIDLVALGFDLALRIANLPDSSLRFRKLCLVRRPLVAAPAYLAQHGHPRHPQELEQHSCLFYTHLPLPDLWHFRHATQGECTVTVRGRMKSNNSELITHALVAGKGLGLQPEFNVWDALGQGKLVEVLPDWRIPDIHVNVVTPPGALRPLRVKLLIDFLAKRLAAAPWAHQAAADRPVSAVCVNGSPDDYSAPNR